MFAKFLIRISIAVAGITLVAGLSFWSISAAASQQDSRLDLFRVPCAREGIVEFLGIAVRPGTATAASSEKEIEIDGKKFKYRPLRVGDLVEAGEVIGRLEDSQARTEVKIRQSRVTVAEADKASSAATREEANRRLQDERDRIAKIHHSISIEELRHRDRTYSRYVFEEKAKEAAVDLAKTELANAQKVLDSYLIRSTARGIVRRIHKHPGEAIRKLETIVTLQLLEKSGEGLKP
jgi:multidrug efflux pump subunit AcrA (membrane-fusion protein)